MGESCDPHPPPLGWGWVLQSCVVVPIDIAHAVEWGLV